MMLLAALSARGERICDMGAAREWCDTTMLRRIEGIWEYPEDRTRVLIRRSPEADNRYDILVIDTPDCRLEPGDRIGYLQETPLDTKFEMAVYREKHDGIFGKAGICAAEFNESKDALLVSSPKVKFSLRSRWFLPSFWRAIGIKVDNPADKLPKGMVRLYPASKRREPDYL